MYTTTELLSDILHPYIEKCRYLKEINITPQQVHGKFQINQSFYITDEYQKNIDRHLNAVEFILCYNQLAFTTLIDFFVNKITSEERITKENFLIIQPDVLITEFNIIFKKMIRPDDFSGILIFSQPKLKRHYYFTHIILDLENGSQVAKTKVAINVKKLLDGNKK